MSREPSAASAAGPGAADRRHRNHRQDHRHVLHDEHAHGDAPVERVDLPAVRQQLHDDDRAREGERHGDVGRGDGVHPERPRDDEPDGRRERDLADARHERHRPERADGVEVELEADDEQQQRDADARQQVNLPGLGDHSETGRPGRDANGDERDDERLAQPCAEGAHDRRREQDQRDLAERTLDRHRDLSPSAISAGRGRRFG